MQKSITTKAFHTLLKLLRKLEGKLGNQILFEMSVLEFFWSVFSRIRTENKDLLCKSPYSVQIRENMDQKNSKHGHFLHSEIRVSLTTNSIPLLQQKCLKKLRNSRKESNEIKKKEL